MGSLNILGVHLVKSKIGQNFSGNPRVQPGKTHDSFVAVLSDLPIQIIYVVLDQPLQVDAYPLGFTDIFVSFSVQNIGFGNLVIPLFHQNHLNDVLNLLHRGNGVSAKLVFHHEGDDIGHGLGSMFIHDAVGFHGLVNGVGDFILDKINDCAIPLFDSRDNLPHASSPFLKQSEFLKKHPHVVLFVGI